MFDRAWAMTLLDQAMDALAGHYAASGKAELFDRIRPVLTSVTTRGGESHAEIGRRLGMTPGAVQVAIHRARARFGRTLRELVAATLHDPTPADVDDEIRGLFAALAS
jgi:RNA polymerase sigma-70 factor (ECF subfamily)